MRVIDVFDTVIDTFIERCEKDSERKLLREMDFDKIFNETIEQLIDDENFCNLLSNDIIVDHLYNEAMTSKAFLDFIADLTDYELECVEMVSNPLKYIGMSEKDFI